MLVVEDVGQLWASTEECERRNDVARMMHTHTRGMLLFIRENFFITRSDFRGMEKLDDNLQLQRYTDT